ncbi:type II toxin-antitoxin system VapC family toxin [Rhizobium tropici]|uniref:Type II toxin-antitoxin system VapC family toxin n=1 Tax=Rhizobium tropici TaxID=398 RepID=A0A5B0WC89_RHITR|nr:type II toxin-antitoxin system VapC family toxin [Rhizobium tropici]KAA1184452.1 type II toxin-antitoxin system VapC family toxin [Rhizobium tropici]
MVKALFDTNILIDHLNAIPQARHELMRYEEKAISMITWMEVLVSARPAVVVGTRAFLAGFAVIAVDDHIAERAVSLRQQYGIKLPDAIIWATANVCSMLLVTRNTKDFPREMPDIRVPYEI